jgi:hypothetical protein
MFTTDDGPWLQLLLSHSFLLFVQRPNLKKFINGILVASSRLLLNDMGLESRNIRDTDELVTRMAIGLSYQVRIKPVHNNRPFQCEQTLFSQT